MKWKFLQHLWRPLKRNCLMLTEMFLKAMWRFVSIDFLFLFLFFILLTLSVSLVLHGNSSVIDVLLVIKII